MKKIVLIIVLVMVAAALSGCAEVKTRTAEHPLPSVIEEEYLYETVIQEKIITFEDVTTGWDSF